MDPDPIQFHNPVRTMIKKRLQNDEDSNLKVGTPDSALTPAPVRMTRCLAA
jgi:hypothetical protein